MSIRLIEAEFLSRIGPPDPVTGCRLFLKKNGEPFESYGWFRCGKETRANRVAFLIYHGSIPAGLCVLHKCDNPPCVAEEHLWAGTKADNTQDCITKGRHGSMTHPESTPRGDKHWSHLHPEIVLRGDRNGLHIHPERAARGGQNGQRVHPEKTVRGEQHGMAKLIENEVREIKRSYSKGVSGPKIAKKFNVSATMIYDIVNGKNWKNVV
jgi:hypothetical protein